MSGYTPGPWRYWEHVGGYLVAGRPADGSKTFVCDVLYPGREVDIKANARLIAAAPDLIEALESLVSHMAVPSSICSNYTAYWDAIAAIKKAKGGTL